MSATPIPWERIASQLDPMLSKEEYDLIRDHYFRTMVAPRLSEKGLSVTLGRDDFMSKTERQSIVPGGEGLAKSASMFLQGSSTLLKTIEPLFPKDKDKIRGLRERVDSELTGLDEIAKREGFTLTPYRLVGDLLGMTPAFAVGEATAGAALGPLFTKLATVGRMSQAVARFSTRASRSGAGFSLYEALSAEQDKRTEAAMKGFAIGVGIDAGLTGVGLLGKKVFQSVGARLERSALEELLQASARGEAIPPPIDKAIAETLAAKKEAAKFTPLANFVVEDVKYADKVSILVKFGDNPVAIDGNVNNIHAIGKALLDNIDAGAEFVGLVYGPTQRARVQSFFLGTLQKRLDAIYGRPFRVLTAEGQEASIAEVIESNRLNAEVVAPRTVQVRGAAIVDEPAKKVEPPVEAPAAPTPGPTKLPAYSLTQKPTNTIVAEQVKAAGLPGVAEVEAMNAVEVVWSIERKIGQRAAAANRLRALGLEALIPPTFKVETAVKVTEPVAEKVVEGAAFEEELASQLKKQRSKIKFFARIRSKIKFFARIPDSERYEFSRQGGFLVRTDKETGEAARASYDEMSFARMEIQRGKLLWMNRNKPPITDQLWAANLQGRTLGVIEDVVTKDEMQKALTDLKGRGWEVAALRGFENEVQVLYFKSATPEVKRAIQLWDLWTSYVRGDKISTLGNISRTLTDAEHRFVAAQMGIPTNRVENFLKGRIPGQLPLERPDRHPLAGLDPLAGRAPIIKARPGRGYTQHPSDFNGLGAPLQADAMTTSLAQVMENYGLRALADPETPVLMFRAGQTSPDMISHEMYHAVISDMPGVNLGHIIRDTHKGTVLGIVKNFLEKSPVYRGDTLMRNSEEAFVYAANAIRYNDEAVIQKLGDADAGVENVYRFVHDTSDDVLRRFKEYDSPLSRIGQRRMMDLKRRSGDSWIDEIEHDIDMIGGDYIPTAEGFRVEVAGKTYRFHEPQKLFDFLLEFEAGLDIAPSWNIRAQSMGMRGLAVPPGMEPTGKTPPLPEVVVDDVYKMGGLRFIEALGRPMKSWVNSVHEAINAAYKAKGINAYLPVSEAWNKVDEQVRSSMAWWQTFIKDWEGIFKGVKGERTKALFRYVSADSSLEKAQFITRLKLTPEEIAAARKWEQWAAVHATDTGQNPLEVLKTIKQLEAFPTGGLDQVFGPLKPPSKMTWIEKAFRDEVLKGGDDNLARLTWQLGRMGRDKKFMKEPLAEFDKLINLKDEEGRYILGNMRWPLQNYSRYVKGLPDMSQQVLTRAFEGVFNVANSVITKINANLPKGVQVPLLEGVPKQIMDNFLLLMYGAGLGLRPAVLMRDSMHPLMTNLPTLGVKWFTEGMNQTLHNRKFWDPIFHKYQVSLKEATFGDVYGDLLEEAGQATKGILQKARQANDLMLTPQRYTTNFGRELAFVGQAERFKSALTRFRKGELNPAQFIEESGMDLYDVPARSKFLAESSKTDAQIALEVSRGRTPSKEIGATVARDVNEYLDDLTYRAAAEYVDLTQWGLRRGTQPVFMQTGIGRIFGQYGTWPLSYLDFMGKVLTRGSVAKRIERMAYWTGINYAAVQSFAMIGADAHHWFWWHSAGYAGSPTLQAALDVPAALEGTEQGRQARQNLARFPLMFVPGSVAMRSWYRAINESGGGWEALQNPRFWGFRPLPEIQQDEDLTEWMEKEFGF